MSELVGATLGDGNVYEKKHYVEYTGDPVKDKYYFNHILLPIVRTETNKFPKTFIHDRGLRFRIFSKSFVEWLKQRGIPSGKARGMAMVPEFIVSQKRLMVRCVRGVHDTDGSVYFDLRPAYLRPYPRLELHMKNKDLVGQVSEFFADLGIAHSYVRTKNSIETSGVEPLARYLREIGFSNLHHVNRIRKFYPEVAIENCCPTSLI